MRACTSCGEVKPVSDFYLHRGRPASRCKACCAARERQRRRLKPEVQQYDRSRGSRQPHAYTKHYRATNPAAYRAQTAVGNALRDGKLQKEPCLFCGEVKVHGHHRDYSKPLDVVWLCAKCHRRLHAYFPETAYHEHADAPDEAA